jgi:hypothetical protein
VCKKSLGKIIPKQLDRDQPKHWEKPCLNNKEKNRKKRHSRENTLFKKRLKNHMVKQLRKNTKMPQFSPHPPFPCPFFALRKKKKNT